MALTSPNPSPYSCTTHSVHALSDADISAMLALYLAHYCETTADIFRADLANKHEVLLLRCAGVLVGFTTWRLDDEWLAGQAIRVLYSGDTVVHRAHWGQQALSFAWLRRMGELVVQGASPMYWLLLVKGHRTFKYLSVFAHRFFPHWQQPEPELQAWSAALAQRRFGAAYQEASGIVRFDGARGQLRPELAQPTEAEFSKASTRFFVARNPGFVDGDELVCLCAITADNMRPLARRLFLGHG